MHFLFSIYYFELFPVGQHAHEACPLYGSLQHLLVLEAHTGVVTLADIPEVINERLHYGVIFPVDVLGILLTEGALLEAGIGTALLLSMAHRGG